MIETKNPGTKVLWDGILKSKYIDTTITPISSYKKNLTMEEKQRDKLQRDCRNIIEHTFGSMKRLFPVSDKCTLKIHSFKYIFRCVCILHNIRNTYVESIRMTVCSNNSCFVCSNNIN